MYQLLSDQAEAVDRLGFDPLADILKDVVLNTEPPFTIGVFGEWGSGKTTMMKLLRAKLEAQTDKPVKTVWFNAWKYDGKEVIWNALIQSVFFAMREDPEVKAQPELMKSIADAATNLAFFVAKRAAPLVTGGLLDGDAVDEFRDAVAPLSATDDAFKFINSFETTFADIVKAYVGETGQLVIFVDDLDRCLPENAVQVLEAIKLYLDGANLTFVIGVEPEVIRTGIRHRYKDNATLAGKEYLEKIIQLPFVMRGLDRESAMKLIKPYAKTNAYHYDDLVISLILSATESNPRRIKRFINSFYVLAQMYLVGGRTFAQDDVRRLALTILTQMRFRAVYEHLVDDPGLIKSFNELMVKTSGERERDIEKSPALKLIYEDMRARRFFELVRDLDCSAKAMKRWVLFTEGGSEVPEKPGEPEA